MMTDKPLENPTPIANYLKSQGAYVINLHGSAMLVGLPDIVCCWRGRFIAVEVKRPGGKLRKLQKVTLQKIEKCGGIAIRAESVDDVRKVLSITTYDVIAHRQLNE